jgi:indole-3-glycerol phosphate synthase
MSGTLERILSTTQRGLAQLRARRPELEREAGLTPVPAAFGRGLERANVAVVAEVKRRSPSAGSIREDLDPVERAMLYAIHGAAAISVLTDGPNFGGSIDDLRRVAQKCPVPLLRKDFILDEIQVLEARAAGASAVLLIVRVLTPSRLRVLMAEAAQLRLDTLVEVHTSAELDVALDANAPIVGINSRDLDTFTIDAKRAWALLRLVPSDRIAVAESGITSTADVQRAAEAGADAVLVGTALSADPHPQVLLQQLTKVSRRGR